MFVLQWPLTWSYIFGKSNLAKNLAIQQQKAGQCSAAHFVGYISADCQQRGQKRQLGNIRLVVFSQLQILSIYNLVLPTRTYKYINMYTDINNILHDYAIRMSLPWLKNLPTTAMEGYRPMVQTWYRRRPLASEKIYVDLLPRQSLLVIIFL